MTRCALLFSLISLLLAPTPLAAQPADPLAADLLKDWMDQKARMVALADAMPAEKYDFKATPPQRTYAGQLAHLAEQHVNFFKRLDPAGKVPPPQLSAEHGKAAVMKSLSDAYDYGSAVLGNLGAGGPSQKAGESTRARVVWGAMNNAMNHYGQCVVYLRLNNIVPPASRR